MKEKIRFIVSALVWAVVLFAVYAVSARAQTGATDNPRAAAKKSVAIQTAGITTPVTGIGTGGQLPKWGGYNGATYTLEDSIITQDKFNNLGIGTTTPTSKLTVKGMIETTLGGYKFPDGTVQTTAAGGGLQSIFHNATLTGSGTQGSPLSVAVPLDLTGSSNNPILNVHNTDPFSGADAISATGADTDFQNFTPGYGIRAKGGNHTDNSDANTFAGVGVLGIGGDNAGGKGGVGIVAQGGTGSSNTGGDGIVARAGSGAGAGRAGYFDGSVTVQGNFNVTGGGTKNFKIDHPLDPENKYLYHAAIESSEVLNIYSGNITTDENGEAVVTLPEWFEAVNRDFRYQLTVLGTFAQAIVGNKVKGNRFAIKTNAPNIEVSWQVTGIRSDAAIRKHPFKVEEDKSQAERGFYLTPEAYDQPVERSIERARNPQVMKQLKESKAMKAMSGQPKSKLASNQ
jgi:hypothetical protein